MKKTPYMLVPNGFPIEWQTFHAPSFEMVWIDGMIGRKAFRRSPSTYEKKILISRIGQALRKVRAYERELMKARGVLKHGRCKTVSN
jgi:hypothetical protein